MNLIQAKELAKVAGFKVTAIKVLGDTSLNRTFSRNCDVPKEFKVGALRVHHDGLGGSSCWKVEGHRVGYIAEAVMYAVGQQFDHHAKYLDFVVRATALEEQLESNSEFRSTHKAAYLLDECVTRENIDRTIRVNSPEYFAELLRHAENELGQRLEEMGLNANDFGFKY